MGWRAISEVLTLTWEQVDLVLRQREVEG
jgi:hypothetical protein